MRIITAGRADTDDYFKSSGVLDSEKLSRTPFLVFVEDSDCVRVQIIESIKKLLTYPDETKVMGQWEGKWRSDFFQFTVRDAREAARVLGKLPPPRMPKCKVCQDSGLKSTTANVGYTMVKDRVIQNSYRCSRGHVWTEGVA